MYKKRILILSSDAGFGHRSTALAIGAALQEKYQDDCQVDIVNPLNERMVPKFMQRSQNSYDRIVRQWPGLYRLGYEANEQVVTSLLFSGSLTVLLYEGIRRLLNQFRPDAVLVTFPLYQPALKACYFLANRQIPTVTVVTDLAEVHRLWFHRVADVCAVATPRVAQAAQKRHMKPERIQITGLPVHPKFALKGVNKQAVRQKLGLEPDKTTVLVVGSKRVGNLPAFLRPLNHANLPIQLIIITGGDDAAYAELTQTEWHLPTRIFNFVEDMPELMHAADCIICKAGGLIITEALACGLPQLLIDAIPGQETGNADYVVNGGAAALTTSPTLLLETLFHWLQDNGRSLKEHATHAAQLGRPLAAYNVAQIAWEAAWLGPQKRFGPIIPHQSEA